MNREDNYYYNGSGYADPTAAAVLSKMTKEIQTMASDPKPFEIWHNAIGQKILVLTVANRSMQFTQVYGLPKYRPGEISIGGEYTDLRFIAYNFADKCKDFVRILTDAEVEKVKNAIASIFEISMGDGSVDVGKLEKELNDREVELSKLRKALDSANDEILKFKTGSPDTSKLKKKISSQQLVIDLLTEKLAEVSDGEK